MEEKLKGLKIDLEGALKSAIKEADILNAKYKHYYQDLKI